MGIVEAEKMIDRYEQWMEIPGANGEEINSFLPDSGDYPLRCGFLSNFH